MKSFKEQKILYLSVCIFAIIIFFIICFVMENNEKNNDYSYLEINSTQNETADNSKNYENDEKIYVHIAGEVINPGLIEAKYGDRISDIVQLAGGFSEEADISRINLAYQVQDGQKIIIPNINDNDTKVENTQEYIIQNSGDNITIGESSYGNKININTASQADLELLTGIGPSLASKIITYRNQNGKFKKIEDIKNVPGIGEEKYKNIIHEITVK